MNGTTRPTTSYRAVSLGLLFFLLAHALGMLSMAVLLRGGMDVVQLSDEARRLHVATHPFTWRLGWLPWQLSALSNLAVSVALLRWLGERGLPRKSAWCALVLWAVAALPEQWSEFQLTTSFISIAQSADIDAFVDAWRLHVWITGVWAALAYSLMTAMWMRLVRRIAGRGAWPWRLELGLLVCFSFSALFTHVAVRDAAWQAPAFAASGLCNALAFPGLLAWGLFAAARLGGAGAHPPSLADVEHVPRWPRGRAVRGLDVLVQDGVRDLMRPLSRWLIPYPTLRSDIVDVVYLTWLVPIRRIEARFGSLGALERYEVDGEARTPLTILNYRHGHFGPRLLGPLRRLLRSPAQSNWRVHTQREKGVRFLKNTLDSPLYAVGSRLLADGLPSHLPRRMQHRREGTSLHTVIEPGDGSAPDLALLVQERELPLPECFTAIAPTPAAVIERIVHRGWVERPLPRVGLINRSDIVLDIGLPTVRTAEVTRFESDWLEPLVEGCEAFAFVVPRVGFLSTHESWREMPDPSPDAASQ